MTSATRTRQCALCRQFYGSGLLANVSAAELLRARRMLLERSAVDDGGTGRQVRHGLAQFLDELSRQRQRQHHLPLDVCALCVQFLPSTYHEASSAQTEEELRALHLAGYASAGRQAGRSASTAHAFASRRSSNAPTQSHTPSSLVIQHQIPKKPAGRARSTDKTALTPRAAARTPRPRSCSRFVVSNSESDSTPTYRLLSTDATRVLRIEAPAATDETPHGLLAAASAMCDLRAQETQQGAAILRAERQRRETRRLRREQAAKTAQLVAQRQAECATGAKPHQNVVHVLRGGAVGVPGAESLYTGVRLAHKAESAANTATAGRMTPAPSLSLAARAAGAVVTRKHACHCKTELLFPALPTASLVMHRPKP